MNLPPPDNTPEEEPPNPQGELPKPSTPPPETEKESAKTAADAKQSDAASESGPFDAGSLNSEAIVSQLSEAAAFPVREKGWSVLMPAVIVIVLMTLVGWIPFLGWIVALAFGCYLAAYVHRSIGVSMRSGVSPPTWPGLEKPMDEILIPGLGIVFAAAVSYLPALLLLMILGEDWNEVGLSAGEVIGMALFAMYFPMAALAMVGRTAWSSVLPKIVLPSIKVCLPDYFVIAAGVFLAEFAREFVLSALGWLPLAGGTAASLVYFYGMLVCARLMGLMYSKHRKSIGW